MDLMIAIAAFSLNLLVVVGGVMMFYFKSEKSISIQLALHGQEIASLFKLINSLSDKFDGLKDELHEIGKELVRNHATRRKNERRKNIAVRRKSEAA